MLLAQCLSYHANRDLRVQTLKLFTTTNPLPSSETELLHIYNGLDCCVTLEVFNAISAQLDEVTSKTYAFALDLQGPIFDMETRGVKVDMAARQSVVKLLSGQVEKLEEDLEKILGEGLGVKCNPNSPAQLQQLLYSTLKLPPVKFHGKVTTNRDALEKLKKYFFAEPIINHILAIRDLKKKISVLKTGIDPDGRIRTSYNIAGTDTGRLSSYASAFGSGTNLQNITGELRSIFVADKGKKLCYIDLEQAESRAVGAIVWNLFQDGSYLDACESGDLHTMVCRLVWDHLGWTGNPVLDKKIAKAPFYRHFDYRDASKRLGHGSNYFGKPPNMARQTHIELGLVFEFQKKYFAAFPGIRSWHEWVRQKLLRDGFITTFMGRRRWFFGRRWDEETLRSAIAYEPQSAIADILNRGMLKVWQMAGVELLLQVHDAIVVQYNEEREEELVPKIMKTLQVEVPLMYGRSLLIPTEAFVGWNWAYKNENNPDGLVAFGTDKRTRTAETRLMDSSFP